MDRRPGQKDGRACLISARSYSKHVLTSSISKKKKRLPSKVQHFVLIAVDSASTHLHVLGIQEHIKATIKEGATPAEIMEVIELTSTLGIHACNIGVPLLMEVLREEGIYDKHPTAGAPLNERRERLKADLTKKRGYWYELWEDFLKLDPEFFERYLNFSSVPWVKDPTGEGKGKGVLEPKVKIAVFSCIASNKLYK